MEITEQSDKHTYGIKESLPLLPYRGKKSRLRHQIYGKQSLKVIPRNFTTQITFAGRKLGLWNNINNDIQS